MPSSRPDSIPAIVSLVRQMDPASILDVGVGFGKWGVLFREYTDIVKSEAEPQRYDKARWRVRIDGIEGFEPYLTPLHRFAYDQIFVGDARRVLPTLGRYDVIFLGDVIEHFTLGDGRALLREALDHAARYVLVSTPRYETDQPASCGNELERHRSLWTGSDFRALDAVDLFAGAGEVLLAVYRRGGAKPVRPRASRRPAWWYRAGLPLAQRVLPASVRARLRLGLDRILRGRE